jgi:D-methionine transport system ATP-binding protein
MEVVKQICDHVALLEDGKIVEEGELAELVVRPHSLISNALFPATEIRTIKPGVTSATITFIGEAADQPVLAGLVKNFDVDVNILSGSIQNISGRRIGRLQIDISGVQVNHAIGYLRGLGVNVEVN